MHRGGILRKFCLNRQFCLNNIFFRKVALFRALMLTIEWSGITIAIFSMMESVFNMLETFLIILTTYVRFEIRIPFKVLFCIL